MANINPNSMAKRAWAWVFLFVACLISAQNAHADPLVSHYLTNITATNVTVYARINPGFIGAHVDITVNGVRRSATVQNFEQNISMNFNGLTPNTFYYYTIQATSVTIDYASGTFTTAPAAPYATTLAASETNAFDAVFSSAVSSNGLLTTVHYEYGVTTNYGKVVYTTAPSSQGSVLDFQGDNVLVATPDVPAYNAAYTVEAWIKPEHMGARAIVTWGNVGVLNQANGLRLSDSGLYHYWWAGDFSVSTPNLSRAWHHVAATYDQTNRVIYLDGVEVGRDTPLYANEAPSTNFRIGSRSDGGDEFFDGQIAEVRVWATAVAATNLTAWKDQPLTAEHPDYAALKGYWPLNEGSGTNILDHSSNGQHGALIGTPRWQSDFDSATRVVGLLAGQTYHYRAVASNSLGVVYGEDLTFTTPTAAPTTGVVSITNLADAGTQFTVSVNPNGETTTVYFGLNSFDFSYYLVLDSVELVVTNEYQSVSWTVSNLMGDFTYNYWLGVSNNVGVNYSSMSFMLPPRAPYVTTLPPGETNANSAMFASQVFSNSLPTLSYFEYGTTTSYGSVAKDVYLRFRTNNTIRVDMPDVPASNSAYTVEAWIKPELSLTWMDIVSWGNVLTSNQANGLNMSLWDLRNYWGTDDTNNLTVSRFMMGEWHHVAATYDQTNRIIYVDGMYAGGDTPTILNEAPSAAFRIGGRIGRHGIPESFIGGIAEVRVWDTALSLATLRAWTNRTVTASHPEYRHLKGYWPLDEDSGTNILDHSLTGQHGEFEGTPHWVSQTNVMVTGLLAGQTYHYRAVASNALGVVYGDNVTFTAPTAAPTIGAVTTTNLAGVGTEFTALINPNGATATVYIKYAQDGSYGLTTGSLELNGNTDQAVSLVLSNLVPFTTYYYQMVASNSVGAYTNSGDFISLPGAPYATTLAASETNAYGAVLSSEVSSNGLLTSIHYEYGLTTNYGSIARDVRLNFNTNSVWVETPDVPASNANYTVEAWIKPDHMGDLAIVTWGNVGESLQANGFRLYYGGLLNYWWGGHVDLPVFTSDLGGAWHHVAVTYDGFSRIIYVDGREAGRDMLYVLDPNLAPSTNFRIGSRSDGADEFFSGQIADVRVWATAIASNNVVIWKDRPLTAEHPDYAYLKGYWPLDEGSGTNILDHSPNGQHGVLIGEPNWSDETNVTVTGLWPGFTYHYRVVASNALGVVYGEDHPLAMPPLAPEVTTLTATNVAAKAATLEAEVVPNDTVARFYFNYGTTTDYGTIVALAEVSGTNASYTMTAVLTNLPPGTTYHYQLVASNSVAVVYHSDTFTTAFAAPDATTLAASETNAFGAVLAGEVSPNGLPTTIYYEYGETTNYGQVINFRANTLDFDTNSVLVETPDVPANNSPYTVEAMIKPDLMSDAAFVTWGEVGTANRANGLRLFTDGLRHYWWVTDLFAYTSDLVGAWHHVAVTYDQTNRIVYLDGVEVGRDMPGIANQAPSTNFRIGSRSDGLAEFFDGQIAEVRVWDTVVTTNDLVAWKDRALTEAHPDYAQLKGYWPLNEGSGTNILDHSPNGQHGVLIGSPRWQTDQSVSIANLLPGLTYHYRVVASNSLGVVYGDDVTFTTPALAPLLDEFWTDNVLSEGTQVTVYLNPNGATTTVYFDYGTGFDYELSASSLELHGNTFQTTTLMVSNLLPVTRYNYRLTVSNSVASVSQYYHFLSVPTAPYASTLAASEVHGHDAMLHSQVSSNGLPTSITFEYGLTTDYGSMAKDRRLNFDVNSVWVETPDVPASNSAYTVEAWIRPNRMGDLTIASWGNISAANQTIGLRLSNNGLFLTWGANDLLVTTSDLAGAWHHVASTYDQTNRVLYLDGVEVGRDAPSVANQAPSANFHIGSRSDGGWEFFKGQIADVRVWATALSPETIQSWTNQTITASHPDYAYLKGYWPMDEGEEIFLDHSPNGRHGVLQRTPNWIYRTNTIVTGLLPGLTYHYRVVASNTLGVVYGEDRTLTTLALAPEVTTLTATDVTTEAATLRGEVVPNDTVARVYFNYGLTTNYGTLSASAQVSGTNASFMAVVGLTNLPPAATYHYQLVASNSVGVVYGEDLTFTTEPKVPDVVTLAASAMAETSATLHAQVNPNNLATSVYFNYGTSTNYDHTTALIDLVRGVSVVDVSQAIIGLAPGTTHYFQAVAFNSEGTNYGAHLSFSTGVLPTVTTLGHDLSNFMNHGPLTAEVFALANPGYVPATLYFNYGPTTDYGMSTEPIAIGSGGTEIPVDGLLEGLSPDTTFHFQAVVSNSVGVVYGEDLSFDMPGAPVITLLSLTNLTATSARLSALITANGGETAFIAGYGTSPTFDDGNVTYVESLGLLPGTATNELVELEFTNLKPGVDYYYLGAAYSVGGLSISETSMFTAPITAPSVTTLPAFQTNQQSAVVQGEVRPNGASAVSYFEYGTTTNYGHIQLVSPRALSFVSNSIQVPITDLPAGTSSYTVEFWFKVPEYREMPILSWGLEGSGTNAAGTNFYSRANYTRFIPDGIASSVSDYGYMFEFAQHTPFTNEWCHAAVTYSGSQMRFYLNGESRGLGPLTTLIHIVNTNLVIGAKEWSWGDLEYLEGKLAQIRIWDTNLSEAALSRWHNRVADTNHPYYAQLKAYLPLSEGSGTNIYDVSGHGNDGQLMGTPVWVDDPLENLEHPIALLEELMPSTTYHYRLVSSNSVGVTYGEGQTFTTPFMAPVPTLLAATDVQARNAVLNGEVIAGSADVSVAFYYSPNANFIYVPGSGAVSLPTLIPAGTNVASISLLAEGLLPATTYYYQMQTVPQVDGAYAVFTEIGTFVTPPDAPDVATLPATQVDAATVALRAEVTPNGSQPVNFFEYGLTTDYGTRVSALHGSLNFSTNIMRVANPIVPTGNSLYTIEFWMKQDQSGEFTATSWGTDSSTQNRISLDYNTITHFTSGSALTAELSESIIGAWHHIAVSYDGTQRTIYLDGEQVAQDTPGTPLNITADNFQIGTPYRTGSETTRLAEVRIWDFVIGQATIRSWMSRPLTADHHHYATSLMAYWPMDDNSGSVVRDQSTYGRHGTVYDPDSNVVNELEWLSDSPIYQTAPVFHLTGLLPNTTYHYRAISTNSYGETYGDDVAFTTPVVSPGITNLPISSLTTTSVVLHADVFTGGADTVVWVEYGLTDSYGDSFTLNISATPHLTDIQQAITGLLVAETYHYRFVASNSLAVVSTPDDTFTTLTDIPRFTGLTFTNLTGSSAVVYGGVLSGGEDTTVYFEYGTTTAYGQTNEVLLGSDKTEQSIRMVLTDLIPGTAYHVRLRGVNTNGDNESADQTFTTRSMTGVTLAANDVLSESAILQGFANPQNAAAVVYYEYGTTDNYGLVTPLLNRKGHHNFQNAIARVEDISLLPHSSSAYTLEAWVRPESRQNQRILQLSNPHAYQYHHELELTTTGVRFSWEGDALEADTEDLSGQWHHIAATYDGTKRTIYLDGHLIAQDQPSAPWYYTPTIAQLGSYEPNPHLIYNFRVWDAAFTAEEVAIAMNQAPTSAHPQAIYLKSHWMIDEGTGNYLNNLVNPWSGNLYLHPSDAGWVTGTSVDPGQTTFTLSDLSPATTYHYRLVVSNATSVVYGEDQTFHTGPGKPVVQTVNAVPVTAQGAQLNAFVNSRDAETLVWFEYGETEALGQSIGYGLIILPGNSSNQYVSLPVTGLTPGVTYYYRVSAANSKGDISGVTASFTTPANDHDGFEVYTGNATGIGPTSATVHGQTRIWRPEPISHFEYGTSTNYGQTTPAITRNWLNFQTRGIAVPVPGPTNDSAYTIEAWIKPNDMDVYRIVNLGNHHQPGEWNELRLSPNGLHHSWMGDSVDAYTGDLSGAWHHVAATYDGTNRSIYLDGQLVRQDIPQTRPNTSPNWVYIGSSMVGGNFNGLIADVRVWEEALNEATLNVWMHQPVTEDHPAYAALKVYFPLDEGGSYIVSDPRPGGQTRAVNETDWTPDTGLFHGQYQASLTNLLPAAEYHYRLVSEVAGQTFYGDNMSFTSGVFTPQIESLTVTDVTSTNAVLNVSVRANGSDTAVYFRYGLTDNYGQLTETVHIPGTLEPQSISATIHGLTYGTQYHFQAVVENGEGMVESSDQVFETLARLPEPVTLAATGVTSTNATLNGSVPFNGARTISYFEYGTSTNYGQIVGAPITALRFNGNYIDVPNPQVPVAGEPYTIEAWIKPDSLSSQRILAWGLPYQELQDVKLGLYWDGAMHSWWPEMCMYDSYDYTDGWHHVAVSFDGANLRFYRDGVEVVTETVEFTYEADASTLKIGGQESSPTEFFDGVMRDVRLWGTDVDAETLQAWMQTPLTAAHPDTALLKGYWPLNEGAGTTINDLSGTGNQGVLHGTPLWVLESELDEDSPSILVAGLLPETVYHYRLVSSNHLGVVYGEDLAFTTAARPPLPVTLAASDITYSNATLNATVDTRGVETAVYFVYGPPDQRSASVILPAMAGEQPVSIPVEGLLVGTTYNFKAVASNAVAVVYGAELTFSTPSLAPTEVVTLPATDIYSQSVVFHGQTVANSHNAAVYFEYGTDTNDLMTVAATGIGAYLGGYVSLYQTTLPSGDSPYTIELWIRPDSMGNRAIALWGSHLLRLGANGLHHSWGSDDLAAVTGDISGSWHHVAASYDGNYRTIYLDGVLVAQDVPGYPAEVDTTEMLLATDWSGDWASFQGALAELRIWNVAVDGERLNEWLGQPLTSAHPDYAQLSSYWPFNEGIGRDISDQSGQDNGYGDFNGDWLDWADSPAWLMLATGVTQTAVKQVTGLEPTTTYYYRLVASNEVATVYGDFESFTTLVPPPSLAGLQATSITATSAVLNVTVDTFGVAAEVYFGYRLLGSGSWDDAYVNLSAESGDRLVSVTVTNLLAGRTYEFHVEAYNLEESSYSDENVDFTTLIPAMVPVTLIATPITRTNAVLRGAVNDGGPDASLYFDLGADTNYGYRFAVPDQALVITNALGVNAPRLPTNDAPYTIETWVKMTGFSTYHLVTWGNNGSGGLNSLYIKPNAVGSIFGDDVLETGVYTGHQDWMHVAVTFDGHNRIIYINGEWWDGNYLESGHQIANQNLRIGGLDFGTGSYGTLSGAMAEVRIWHTALDESVLLAWKNRRVTAEHPDYAQLAGYWPLNENISTSFQDHSPNGKPAYLGGYTSAAGNVNDIVWGSAPAWLRQYPLLNLSDLLPGNEYHYRLVSSNSVGVAYGEDESFTTDYGHARSLGLERPFGRTVKVSVAKLLAMVDDVELDETLSLIGVEETTSNGASVYVDGNWVIYQPAEGYNDTDTFTFRVSDSRGAVAQGTVTVVIREEDNGQSFNLISVTVQTGGAMQIQAIGLPGRSYTFQATTNLTTPVWVTLGDRTAGANGLFEFTDPDAINHTQRYYRTIPTP